MKRSGPKLLTSHAGSLPRTDAFIEQNRLRAEGGVDEGSFQAGS